MSPSHDAGVIELVDGDAANLEELGRMLGSLGRVVTARSGEDAVGIARGARPLIILVNEVLPGIDGYETCRRLKDDPCGRDAAVILISKSHDATTRTRGFEVGAVDFIAYPFVQGDVIARVNTHLAIRRDLREDEHLFPATMRELADATPAAGDDVDDADVPGPAFHTGEILASRFRIVSYLARGGMGELYEAEDLELREHVALKTILSTIAKDERTIQHFKREVHLARQVTHPNVCRIYDVYRHRPPGSQEGAHEIVFLAMELLSGETLAERLHRVGRFKTDELLPIARQMAAALAAAHRAGVVHRDFKSHNVMLVEAKVAGQQPRVVVTDFGLARRSHHDNAARFSLSLSDVAEVSGTPEYMAPEQVEGGAVTPATDVYAFGVVLYELVTGVCPFVADTPMRTATRRLLEPPPSPRTLVPDLDPRWDATIRRCLAREPADRFTHIEEAAESLEGPRVEGAAEPVPANQTRRRPWAMVAAAIVAVAVAAAGYAWYGAQPTAGVTSIAVLPFETTGADPEQDYISDGLSEALIGRLSELPGIKVVANSSSSRYKGQKPDLRDVARALDVAAILAGKVVQRGDSLSISVELINGADRTRLWGDQYVRKVADLIQVPDEISRDVAGTLQVSEAAGDPRRGAMSGAANPKAYELVLRGHFHRAKGSTEDRQRALEYFRQAIEADPRVRARVCGPLRHLSEPDQQRPTGRSRVSAESQNGG